VTAFSAGLLDGGVAPTLKHFPGLGLATVSTDDAAVTIDARVEALAPGSCRTGARSPPGSCRS
jgi:beta-N-acetylhexosaminidase